jgi:hypothetical protein
MKTGSFVVAGVLLLGGYVAWRTGVLETGDTSAIQENGPGVVQDVAREGGDIAKDLTPTTDEAADAGESVGDVLIKYAPFVVALGAAALAIATWRRMPGFVRAVVIAVAVVAFMVAFA